MSFYHSFIMFPTNATALILGRKLLSNFHDLSLFCPSDLHVRQACTTPYELRAVAKSLGRKVHLVNDLGALNTADFIIFPTLDVDHSETREAFAKMVEDLFQCLKTDMNMVFKKGAKVIFGSNVSGLVCAFKFREAFPNIQDVYIASSIYSTSRKVFDSEANTRVFPMVKQRGTMKLVYSAQADDEEIKPLRGAWSLDMFNDLEASALMELVLCITDHDEDKSVMEVVGRFPSDKEAIEYEVAKNTPVWLPTGEDCSQFTKIVKEYLSHLSEWLAGGCKEYHKD